MKTDNSNKPGSDCSSGASSTDAALVLETYLSHLLAASPKLDIAAKNLIAVLLGAESARSETDMMSTEVAGGKSTISSSPSSSAPTTTALPVQSPSLGRREEIRADVALKCVRLILKAVALLTLPDTPQWGVEHPQGEKQTFSERAEQLSHYKVCLMLLTRAQQSSTSPSKLLGQEFFQVTKCWPKVRAAAMAAAPSDVPPAALETCLDLFERSIEGGPDADLVWATDFAAAVHRRREMRAREAKERVRVELLADAESDDENNREENRHTSSGSGGGSSTGVGPSVVSVDSGGGAEAIRQLRDIVSGVAQAARISLALPDEPSV